MKSACPERRWAPANRAGFATAYSAHSAGPPPGIELPLGPQEWVWSTSVPDFAVLDRRSPAKVTVTTTRALDPASVNGQIVKLLDGKTGVAISAAVQYDAATRTISVYSFYRLRGANRAPAFLPSGRSYRLLIGAIKDTAGNTGPATASPSSADS